MKYIHMSVWYTLGYYAYLFAVLHLIINVQLLNTVEESWRYITTSIYDILTQALQM